MSPAQAGAARTRASIAADYAEAVLELTRMRLAALDAEEQAEDQRNRVDALRRELAECDAECDAEVTP